MISFRFGTKRRYIPGGLRAVGGSHVDGFYTGFMVAIIDGQGAGQSRRVTSYNGPTRTLSIAPDWSTPPDQSSVFAMCPMLPPGGSMSDLLVNSQTLRDIQAWGSDEIDETTRREIFASGAPPIIGFMVPR